MRKFLLLVFITGMGLSAPALAYDDIELLKTAKTLNALQDDAGKAGLYRKNHFINEWIRFKKKDKIFVINGFKNKYKQQGYLIRKESEAYMQAINEYLYLKLVENDIDAAKTEGLGAIFKRIAVEWGDYQEAD